MAHAKRLIFLLTAFLTFSAVADEDLKIHAAHTSSRDVAIPVGLVKRIEKNYEDYLAKEGVVNKSPVKRVLLNVRADLRQERPGALHENSRVMTPLGGGIVDLAELVTPVRGAFTATIEATTESGEAPDNMHVYFVSHARSRKIDREDYGAGCGKWMEITRFFRKAMKSGGFELYTAGQRYLSVVGGTFVMVGFSKDAISVGSLTLTDSRYPDALCE